MKTLKTSNPIKNEKKIEQTFHFTKQIHREQIPCVEREDAKMLNIISYQRHTKLKPWDTTTHLLEVLKLKTPIMANIGEDVDELELLVHC